MAFDMNDYFKCFNTLTEEEFCEKFYTEDLQVESQFGTLPNRDAWLHALNDAHDGIVEDLQPRVIVGEGDKMMVESVATFTATKDMPDFMHGALKKGESVPVRFFATYHLRGDKIARMALGWWAPEREKIQSTNSSNKAAVSESLPQAEFVKDNLAWLI